MRALLWTVLAVAVMGNVIAAFLPDAGSQVIVNIATGIVVLASCGGLVLARKRHSCV
ncbi:LPXTG cell wall anchor domain-containing protein [Nocardiopsis sediminis]|uniref:LPXTG cell wall anchor domain-containing protein n=1 Tax=Nocardiopsis sediminis TaxID=1778267 RepID=A0ABV8FSJ9_9ACTN